MRTRASRITGAIALAVCFVCPLVEMFDQWDHTLQTGNDTEYLFVLLALCVGAVFVLRQFIVALDFSLSRSSVRFTLPTSLNSLSFLNRPAALTLASASPPLSLRI